MRLLDLFCGAGGAAMGYSRAGFTEIVGVDNRPQKRYPFTFVLGDALAYVRKHGREFDAIHASPPCQKYTTLRGMWNHKTDHPDLVGPTRRMLQEIGCPYAIENVPGSPLLRGSLMLCGTMFGLTTADGRGELQRHRYFELSHSGGLAPPCQHRKPVRDERGRPITVVGVYGGGTQRRYDDYPVTVGVYGDGNGRDYRRRPKTVGVYGHAGGLSARELAQGFLTKERAEAMGIDWMTGDELSQAIPPAYTEFIGKQLIAALQARREPHP
jgi:DNA (cytosine-5)-methyltransferase 1